jgi:hypothetical protein
MESINPPLPRLTPIEKAPTAPVEKVVLTKGTVTAHVDGVIVTLSPEVQWMKKKGIIR